MPFSSAAFPNLNPSNHQIVAPANKRFNCIAWAVGRDSECWDPKTGDDPDIEYYWPENAASSYETNSLIMAFESVNFVIAVDGTLQPGIEKIAIYADGKIYEHAARQLENGKWTSKMGKGVIIEHDTPEDVAGPAYGHVVTFMQRKRAISGASRE